MNYKLAEKLYKAKFPNMKCSEENPTSGYSYPTLSELVKAYGDDINKFIGSIKVGTEKEREASEVAIALHWLKLNEK